jgi:hypothetical protein
MATKKRNRGEMFRVRMSIQERAMLDRVGELHEMTASEAVRMLVRAEARRLSELPTVPQ